MGGKAAVSLGGAAPAVPQLVVTAHQIARTHEGAGELVVALDVLRHAVDQLHHAAWAQWASRTEGVLVPPDEAADPRAAILRVELYRPAFHCP